MCSSDLSIDDQPAAFTYNYHHEGRLYGMRMGYDQAISNRGLGKVLIARNLEDSFERGDHSFDMGVGDYNFKRGFRTDVETSYQFSHYPSLILRAQGVRLTRWLKGRLSSQQNGEKLQKSS